MELLVNFVIVLVITGFVAWALSLLVARFVPLDATFKSILNGAIWVIAIVVIVYYGVLPLIAIA